MVSFDLAEGNPGCLTFMMEAYMGGGMPSAFKAEKAFQRMQSYNIKGAKLYMLWNDCCNRNTPRTLDIMLEKPIEDILEHINYEGGRGISYSEEATADRYPGESEDILKAIDEAGKEGVVTDGV